MSSPWHCLETLAAGYQLNTSLAAVPAKWRELANGHYDGMLKAFLFGVIIVITACHQGFATTQGAVGVGNATRRTVIMSFLSILIVGYFITRLFYV